ncbi:MAG: DUF2062 domain-containing protein [Deltaproteobacteria bacterium]|nr:DUF2062 domain-containing protein [Deltaproteobacteria bacterium]
MRKYYDRFLSLRGEPRTIAMGMAIGVFVGVTPTIPLHTVLIVLVGITFRQNISAGYLGSWLISNPLTIPFFYVAEYRLGKYLLGNHAPLTVITDYSLFHLLQYGWGVAAPLLAGGIVIAPFFAVPAYFITRRLLIAVRNKKTP